jgi:Vault protein inter-alpha-trypsin domain/von Willebrand factor type A domain
MPALAAQANVYQPHPLDRFRDGAINRATRSPISLRATRIKVRIAGGLAVVRTERVFTNAEAAPIEATYTFPVPVQATLARLTARIGERHLVARARRRDAARATYEAAIDAGRTAVLHEEVMRGIHMLSVGPIPPGVEVVISSTWAMPLQAAGEHRATLRIPTTIGQVYGRPPMADSDAPLLGDAWLEAELAINCDSGVLLLDGRPLQDGRTRLPLNRPIDLELAGWTPTTLRGRAADGRAVTLKIAPAWGGLAPLNVALLMDRSGSMGAAATQADGGILTTHGVVVRALQAADALLRPGDRVAAWQFDTEVEPVSPHGDGLGALAMALGGPRGGTEVGKALQTVITQSSAPDILLLTDGQSYALNVQALARAGRRITVVLVGAGALDAQVGHLAALTGGELFVVTGADAGDALRQAIASLRRAHVPPPSLETLPDQLERTVGGMRVVAGWTTDAAPDGDAAAIVGAVAAALALPGLPAETAAELAQAHGLVCHLTSLVLVDDEGVVQEGLPAQRRVPLMAPGHLEMFDGFDVLEAAEDFRGRASFLRAGGGFGRAPRRSPALPAGPAAPRRAPAPPLDRAAAPSSAAPPVGRGAGSSPIDWAGGGNGLLQGDLSALPPGTAERVRRIALLPAVVELASMLGKPPVVVALALIALTEAGNRHAARVTRHILGGTDQAVSAKARAVVASMW